MYLHEQKTKFRTAILQTSELLKLSPNIVEKDYYVTMVLDCLIKNARKLGEDFIPVFKGGTSLSKCFHLINRFSEDVDITFIKRLGESRRKQLKYKIVGPIGDELGLDIVNWNRIESNRDLNCYDFGYRPLISSTSSGVNPVIKLEITLISQPFPTKVREVDNFIYRALGNKTLDLAEYELEPFSMNIQTIERTFIDKIFALCDYYMNDQTGDRSRHLYDIHMLYPLIKIDNELLKLIEKVRAHRKTLPNCPSADDKVNLKALITKFLDSDFYKKDYMKKTKTLISDGITYDQTVNTLRKITRVVFQD